MPVAHARGVILTALEKYKIPTQEHGTLGFKEILKQNIDFDIEDINIVDENNELASSLGILSIPTLLLYKQGKLVSKKIGFQSKDELKSWIEENK